MLETIYTFKNYLYIATSGYSHKMKWRRLVKYIWGVFNKTVIPLALVEYEMIIANSTLRALLAIYHLISNARSRNNCYNDYKRKGTVPAEENKDPRSHQVIMKNGMPESDSASTPGNEWSAY